MYKQEKKYLVLIDESDLREKTEGEAKGFAGRQEAKKNTEAGLQKITLTDRKIRVDYYLNPLPIPYDVSMECRLKYRNQGETTTTQVWREKLVKNNSHYTFQLYTDKEIEEVQDCRLSIRGNYLVLPGESLSSQVTQAEGVNGENIIDNTAVEGIVRTGDNTKTEDSVRTEDLGQEMKLRKNTPFSSREVTYIRDLEYLKQMGSQVSDLYYNSFLLHGFYQHHYFIVGKDFIGVPDHFYEREAIAAKMMGFPYFIEGENVENCNISGEIRNELPKTGSFGYFLKKVNLSPLEKPME